MSRVPGEHIDTLTIQVYAAQLVDVGTAAAVEHHLMCCEDCRARVAAVGARNELPGVESVRLQRIWDAVTDVIDSPSQSMPTPVGFRLRSEWRRLRQILARCLTPATGMAPTARCALVTVVALTLPVLITISGSASLPVREPFDTVLNSDHQLQTFGAARALAHTPGSAGGGIAPCAVGEPGCAAGGLPVVRQRPCAPTDLAFTVDWLSAGPGHGTLRVTNVGGTVCLLPAVLDVEPKDGTDGPVTPVQNLDSMPPSPGQLYRLYPSRPAESSVSWLPWCGASTATAASAPVSNGMQRRAPTVTIHVEWNSSSTEVTGTVPVLPVCPPGAGQPTLTAGQLSPAFVSRSEYRVR